MKSLLTFVLLFAVANALSLDALREMLKEELSEDSEDKKEVTLREYLEDLEEPHPLYRSERSSVNDCANICGSPPALEATATCDSKRWKPNYTPAAAGCECLTAYKCCSGKCEDLDMQSCWKNNNKGLLYATVIKDCCDCDVVKCEGCEAPQKEESVCPRGNGARPTDCYSYTKNHHYADDDRACYQPDCDEKSSDAPTDEVCDANCQNVVENESHCKFGFKTCAGKSTKPDCRGFKKETAQATLNPKGLHCYNAPTEVADEDGGHYYDGTTKKCAKCTKWDYEFKSCAAKNEAAASEDCHEYGEKGLDKKCFKKQTKQDDCGCNVAECIQSPVEEGDEFAAGEICPTNHVKMSGVSVCLKPRDLCKMCPTFIPMHESDCPKGRVERSQDCNGCAVSKCVRATVPNAECACNKYNLNTVDNVLTCGC